MDSTIKFFFPILLDGGLERGMEAYQPYQPPSLRAPRSFGGDPYAGGIGNSEDGVTQDVLAYLLFDDRHAIITAVNRVMWLRSHLPKIDNQHIQRHCAAAFAAVAAREAGAIDADTFWAMLEVFNAAYFAIAERTADPKHEKHYSHAPSDRHKFRQLGAMVRLAHDMKLCVDLGFTDEAALPVTPAEMRARGIDGWKWFESAPNWTTEPHRYLNRKPFIADGGKWPWMPAETSAQIGNENQPFMHFSIAPREWLMSEMFLGEYEMPARTAIRALSTWALLVGLDRETGLMLSAIKRGTYNPDLITKPLSEWTDDEKREGGLESQHSPLAALVLAEASLRAKKIMFERIVGANRFLKTPGQVEEQTLLALLT
jgi:hypothetical protein